MYPESWRRCGASPNFLSKSAPFGLSFAGPREEGMSDNWHRRHAVHIISQLLDNADDARAVLREAQTSSIRDCTPIANLRPAPSQ